MSKNKKFQANKKDLKGIESLPQTLNYNLYIFGTQCHKSLIFLTLFDLTEFIV